MNPDAIGGGQLPPGASLIVVFVVLTTLFLAFVWALFRWRTELQRAAESVASVSAGPPPPRGAVVLHGVVETEEPERPAITVTIWEHGEETETKNGWTHTWTETRREVRTEPFYLKLSADGSTVRVEPDEDVFLVDALEVSERGNPRTRRAELTNGETAYVAGVIGPGRHARADTRETAAHEASAYRGGPKQGLVLRSGRNRMLVSTEPLDERYRRHAKAHRLFAIIFGVALAVASTLVYGRPIAIELFGRPVDAEVVGGRTWITVSKNTPTRHFELSARYRTADGPTIHLVEKVSDDTYSLWQAKRLPHQLFVVAFDRPWLANIGSRPTIHIINSFVWPFVAFALLLMYGVTLRAARAWYERAQLKTTGSGPLVL